MTRGEREGRTSELGATRREGRRSEDFLDTLGEGGNGTKLGGNGDVMSWRSFSGVEGSASLRRHDSEQ